jgi:DNA (cytosine-5)-methyltransferase 1
VDAPRIVVVDVFCGVGGLTHGFVKENIEVAAGLDSDVSCRYAYEHNNTGATFIHKKIEDVRAEDNLPLYPPGCLKVLVGCAPCQPYSSYTRRQRRSKEDGESAPPKEPNTGGEKKTGGEKWELLAKFADLIEAVRPDIVSMENVTELTAFIGGSIYRDFVRRVEATELVVTDHVVYCPDYGMPQKRKRLVLFASKFGKVSIVEPTHTPNRYKTVAAAIGHLPRLEAGQTCSVDPLHRASGLSELNLRRIKHSAPGGSWKDWPKELRAGCHTKESGESYGSVYGRMKWTEPSPTMTTQCHGFGNGRFGHPEQDRAISIREAALLQTFPSDYAFVALDTAWHVETVARHVGNAVPVDLGRVIARSIRQHVMEEHHVGR